MDRIGRASAVRAIAFVCAAQVLVQIGAFFWPALLPEMMARWSLTNVRAGFVPYARPRVLGISIPMLSGLLNRLVNVNTMAVELFERYLCGIWSIYEIEYRIEKRIA